ncbi:hypothetical protein HDV00_008941 [Rhizophlyctis rosea]|nr:hypothetical protein HDV00_008941 [Rhizophlyctis rosea]
MAFCLRRASTLPPTCLSAISPSPAIRSCPFSTTPISHSIVGQRVLKYPHEVQIRLEPAVPTPSHPYAKEQVVVTGPKGSLTMPLQPFVRLNFPKLPPDAPKKELTVSVANEYEKKQKAMWGTTRGLLGNMVEGVLEGYTLPVRFVGVGYRAVLEDRPEGGGKRLNLKLGYSHPVIMDIPEHITVQVPVPNQLILSGIDKHEVTLFASKIRKWRKPEPYNQKGIFVGDETIKKKEGKKR